MNNLIQNLKKQNLKKIHSFTSFLVSLMLLIATTHISAQDDSTGPLQNKSPDIPTQGDATEPLQNESPTPTQNDAAGPFQNESPNIPAEQVQKNKELTKKWEVNHAHPRAYNHTGRIHKLSAAYSNKRYNNAKDHFARSNALLKQMNAEIKILKEKNENLYTRYKAKHSQYDLKRYDENRSKINHLLFKYRNKSAVSLYRAIDELDLITNENFREQTVFINFLEEIYKAWTVQQYKLGNLDKYIPILKEYALLRPNKMNEKEYPIHFYLAEAYQYRINKIKQFAIATKTPQLEYFESRRQYHLLYSYELLYGKKSTQYRQMIVDLENQ